MKIFSQKFLLVLIAFVSVTSTKAFADADQDLIQRLLKSTTITVTDAGLLTVPTPITISGAVSRIVPGATSLSLRNAANDADNLICTDAGVCTNRAGLVVTAGGVTVTAGDIVATNGDISLVATGKTIEFETGTAASACMGTSTINGTTAVTISTTCATTTSKIFISRTSDGSGSAGNDQVGAWTTNIVNGVSFDLDSADANDSATINWVIYHEAP